MLFAVHASFLTTGLLVGIDLGTTNSAIALLRGGEPSLLPNARGEPLTPSTVAFTGDGTVLVGAAADLQASQNVRNTVVAAKRFIGRTVRQCKAEIARAQYTVVGDEDGAAVFRLPAVGDLSPEEAGACVLAELLGALDVPASEICRAVVTVPAYFDAPQRQATLAAARLAGLGSVSLLAEPVAASLAYGLGGAVGKVLVLDLGAGTYDVSVLQLGDEGAVEVLATSGDPHLGGTDFDAAIVALLLAEARRRALPAIDHDEAALRTLRERAEAAKRKLSVVKRVSVLFPSPQSPATGDREGGGEGDEGTSIELTRDAMEAACEPLLQRLKAPLYEVALAAAVSLPGEAAPSSPAKKRTAKARRAAEALLPSGKRTYLPRGEPLAEVVLVGGATQMAAVRKLVANLFGIDPRRTVAPMEAVALGAAVHAGMLAGALSGHVMQAWQAELGRLMEGSRAPATEGGAEEEDDLPFSFTDEGQAR